MAPKTLREFVSSQRRVNLVVWVAFAWSIALLTGVAYYTAEIAPSVTQLEAAVSGVRVPAEDGMGWLKIATTGFAVALCFASVVARRVLAGAPASGAAEAPVPIGIAQLPEEERTLALGYLRQTTANFVGWALGEAVLLCGLTLVFMTREFNYLLPFLGASLLLHFIAFPRVE